MIERGVHVAKCSPWQQQTKFTTAENARRCLSTSGTESMQVNRVPTRKLHDDLLLVQSFGNVQEAVVFYVGV